ncbi:MAG: hypothetical protein WKF74_00700 [Pyrinomonadaceae bacterium]
MIKFVRFGLRNAVLAVACILTCGGAQTLLAQDLPPVKGSSGSNVPRPTPRTAPAPRPNPRPAPRPNPPTPAPRTAPRPTPSPQPRPTQTAQADPRVRAALDSLGMPYEIDGDGDYKLTLNVPNSNGRTQLVYINTRTERLGSMEIREVWAPAIRSNGPFTEAISNQLLKISYDKELGAWQTMLFQNGQVYMAVYAAKIAAASDPQALRASIDAVLKTADAVELQVTGKDDF